MNSIITNTGKFSGGYFVLNKSAKNSSFNESEEFVVTSRESRSLSEEIMNLISSTENYIKICSFIIDNKQIVEALENQLKKGNIAIFILTAVDERNIKSNMLDEDESSEFSKSRHFEFIDELVKAGAHIRASNNAHAKFVIKDGNRALLMSANLTEPSLNCNEKGNEPNKESGIILNEIDDIKTLERLFDAIFLYGTEYRKFINLNDNTQLISKNENEILEHDFPGTNSNVIWTYDTFHQLIYEKMNSIIVTGSTLIKLSTYSIIELNNLPELVHNIESFIREKRGSIKIFCRAMNHRSDHLAACRILATIGVEIYGDMFNHSKGISIDNNHGIIFTANIDGKHGLKSGFEVGYIFENSNKSFVPFNSFLDYQIGSAPYIFLLTPQKNELYEFYRHWYIEKEIKIQNTLPVSFEIKYKSNTIYTKDFEEGISNYPIFYTLLKKPEKNEVQFEINDKTYLLEILNETTFALKKQLQRSEIAKVEKYMLFYNMIKMTSYES
jgi:hypothetical protein